MSRQEYLVACRAISNINKTKELREIKIFLKLKCVSMVLGKKWPSRNTLSKQIFSY